MLGALLIYWIGKYFYQLAEEHEKSKCGYAILGIAIYYLGSFGAGIVVGIVFGIISPGYIETVNETLLSVLLLPFGILACYVLYKYLEKSWNKNKSNSNEIEEIGRAG